MLPYYRTFYRMAIKSTVYKANLQIADMDRHYYHEHALTLSMHPSETEERLMVRLLAFALHADERLEFGQGMTDENEADLWRKDLTGAIEQWIDVGLPDEKLIRKACGRAEQVIVYCYGGRTAELWFSQNSKELARLKNLTVFTLAAESTQAMANMVERTMSLQCTIQDGQMWFGNGQQSVEIGRTLLKSADEKTY
jgi:uncharacterized protein YaeQ